jgi:hypothetical protein
VRDEPSVSASQDECRNAVLDARQQPAHRCSVADPDVRDAVVVDIISGLEEVDSAAEVDHQLDLVGTVALGEVRQLAAP